jgi:hypothetical protein
LQSLILFRNAYAKAQIHRLQRHGFRENTRPLDCILELTNIPEPIVRPQGGSASSTAKLPMSPKLRVSRPPLAPPFDASLHARGRSQIQRICTLVATFSAGFWLISSLI